MALAKPVARSRTTVRLLQWNVHDAIGTDDKRLPQRIAVTIAAVNPDIVCLNEASVEVSEDIQSYLRSHSPPWYLSWAPADPDFPDAGGNAILSRYLIIREARARFLFPPYDSRVMIQTRLQVSASATVDVISTHLEAKVAQIRGLQASQLREWCAQFSPQRIICGDLNALETAEEIQPHLAEYDDVWTVASAHGVAVSPSYVENGHTHPRGRVDHVLLFRESSFELKTARIVETEYALNDGMVMPSDHHPLLIELGV